MYKYLQISRFSKTLNKLWHKSLLVFCLCLLLTSTASAQMFGASSGLSNQQPAAAQQQPAAARPPARFRASSLPEILAPADSKPTETASKPTDKSSPAKKEEPAKKRSETKKSNPPAIVQLRFVNGEVVVEDLPKIMLYMRDFKIDRNINNRPSCSARFYILSSIPEKITNISYRLKWPEIETALSFNDVEPNTPTYFDYTLLGDGCYSMDKAPNIIVNRCRIKGMSQRQCADAIQWME